MGQRGAGSAEARDSLASRCGLDPVLLCAVLAAQARETGKELPPLEDPPEIELEHQRLGVLERRTDLIMGVVVRVFAMGYLVAVLILAPLLLAPTGVFAALYLWRRGT